MDCQFRIDSFIVGDRIWYRGSRCGLSGCTGRGIVFCLTGTVESADYSQHRLAESRGKYFQCVEVETEEDLNALLPELLGAVPGRDGMSVADHYMESREQLEFAHMVIFFTGASGEPGRIGKSVYSDGSDLFRRGSRV